MKEELINKGFDAQVFQCNECDISEKIRQPMPKTIKAMKSARKGRLVYIGSADELLAELNGEKVSWEKVQKDNNLI